MAWNKAYSNWITWVNKPSTQSPIDQIALNKISNGLDTVDDRVISLDSTKANQSDFLTVVQSIALNQSTGELVITAVNGTVTRIDTLLEKIAVNFDFDDDPTSQHYQNLIIELDDGTYKYIDLSALITEYEFTDTDTITFDVAQDGSISAVVKEGSIEGKHLNPNYLAQITSQVTAAQTAATTAGGYASDCNTLANVCSQQYLNAKEEAQNSEAWAVGTRNGTPVPRTDETYENNSKYYAEQAQQIVDDSTITFTQASTRANINSGEAISTIMGKIKKFFADLKTVAFTGNSSDVSYTNTTSGLSATNVQGAIDEVVDISGNTSSALVEQSIGTFPEFAISTNSADSYYSGGRGGARDSNDKIIIIGMCRYDENHSGQYYVGFMLYGTSAQALAQSSYTQYGAIGPIRTFVTPQGNTVYVTWQGSGWVFNTVTNPYTAGSTTVTINGNTATLNNVFVQNTSGVVASSQADKMLLTIVDEVLFGTKEYSSGIYQVKSNNEIISLFENSVAHNEPTTTSSQAYSVGQYMTQNGNLKKVTSAIASGESITSNNTSNTTVGAELTQINSDLSVIGNVYSTTTLQATSVPATTETTVLRLSNLPLGTYIALGYIYGSTTVNNTGGIMQLRVTNNVSVANTVQNSGFLLSGSVSAIFQITNTTNVVSVSLYCTNAQTLTSGRLAIVRIA